MKLVTPPAFFALVVEDKREDFELVAYALRSAGFAPHCQRVETEAEYLAQLSAGPDIVLADYSLPEFGALRALELMREQNLDIPVIVLTGAVSEETVVECMKQGAADYLLKDRLVRLGPAVSRALVESKLRAAKREADASLKECSLRFQILAETTKVIPWELDMETCRFTYVGPQAASLMGYPREDWYVQGFWEEHVHPEDREALQRLCGNCDAPQREHDFECRMQTCAGATIHLRCVVTTLTGDNPRGFMFDISELKETEQVLLRHSDAMQDATRAKSDFLARMSHEIRTPMNAILGMADLLWDTRLDTEQRQYVGAFRRAGGNLLTLINDLLDLSKIESGRIDLQSVDFDLDEVVAATMDLMRVRADAKGLDIFCELQPDVPRALRGDPDRLRQVLINLLGNAVKFTSLGHVRLRIERDRAAAAGVLKTLRFSVSDTGVGIPLEKQSLIFETFTQADGSISRQYGGTGLGLTISRQIVQAMGGLLEVSSSHGEGSTFGFAVPCEIAAQASPRPDPDTRLVCEPPVTGLRVLLAEDSKDNQLLISAYLKQTARTLEIAADGQAAVDRFIAGHFDLVLMDVQMPVMDGYAATRAIRQWEALQGARRTPILALSAHAMEEAFERSLEAGCDAHLTKPITKPTLLRAIGEHCKGREPICVPASKDVPELAPWYLDGRRSDLLALARALDACDYNAIRILGHNMKGSGCGYGFDAISRIGATLEAAARQESSGLIGAELSMLGDYLDRVEVVP